MQPGRRAWIARIVDWMPGQARHKKGQPALPLPTPACANPLHRSVEATWAGATGSARTALAEARAVLALLALHAAEAVAQAQIRNAALGAADAAFVQQVRLRNGLDLVAVENVRHVQHQRQRRRQGAPR